MIPKDGEVTTRGSAVVVRTQGQTHLAGLEGVHCVNPEEAEAERVYEKTFINKRVFLPGDPQALSKLNGSNVVVLGMTGYSSIKEEDCYAWGIQPGAYEAACEDLLRTTVKALRSEFPEISVRIAEGASNLGVDKAALAVCRDLQIEHLGFSCPNFMFYVKDDEESVYVAPNQAAYADAFIKSLHILIGANGRMQALEHDMVAAIKYNKRLILANVVKTISNNGGAPARDSSGRIIDATAAFQQCITSLVPRGTHSSDPYRDLRRELTDEAIRVARAYLEPSVAFASSKKKII